MFSLAYRIEDSIIVVFHVAKMFALVDLVNMLVAQISFRYDIFSKFDRTFFHAEEVFLYIFFVTCTSTSLQCCFLEVLCGTVLTTIGGDSGLQLLLVMFLMFSRAFLFFCGIAAVM